MRAETEVAAVQVHVLDQIDKRDANTIVDYAAWVEGEISSELIRNLVLAVIETDPRIWRYMLGQLGAHKSKLASALSDIGVFTETQRQPFAESAALAILKELER